MSRRIITAAVAALALAAVAACSTPQEPDGEQTGPMVEVTAPDGGQIDQGPEETVSLPSGVGEAEYEAKVALARQAAEVMSTWTPGQDLNWTDSELRARDLMTEEKAAQVVAPERPASGPEWHEAAEEGATSVPRVVQNLDFDLPAQTEEDKEALVISMDVSWTWETSEARAWPGSSRTYYFSFTDTEPYKIAGYTYDEH